MTSEQKKNSRRKRSSIILSKSLTRCVVKEKQVKWIKKASLSQSLRKLEEFWTAFSYVREIKKKAL